MTKIIEPTVEGMMTIKQVVRFVNESKRLAKPITAPRWDYITRSRGIEPDGELGGWRAHLWSRETVERVINIMLEIERIKATIIKPTRPRKT